MSRHTLKVYIELRDSSLDVWHLKMATALQKSPLVHEPPILELRLFEIVPLIKFAALSPTKELVCLAALKLIWPSVFDSTWRSRPRRPDLRFVVVNCNASKAIMLTEC